MTLKLVYSFKLSKARKKTEILCKKMLDLYNYFVATHPGATRPSESIKEVVPLMNGWKPVSKDVFRHSSGGVFEVKTDDNLEAAVRKMATVEIESYAKSFPKADAVVINKQISAQISEFFQDNRPR
jgi:hypothetical protein